MKTLLIFFFSCLTFSFNTKLIYAITVISGIEKNIDCKIKREKLGLLQNQIDSTFFYCNKALRLAEKNKSNKSKIVEANNHLKKIKFISDSEWLIYSMNLDYSLLKLAELKQTNLICNEEINIQPIINIIEQKDTFNYVSAKAYHFQCLGLIFYYLEDYSKCINYLKSACKEYESIKDENQYISLVTIYSNLANTYSRINDFSKAEIYLNKVLNFKKKLKSFNDSDNCELFCTFGINSYLKKEYIKSIEFLDSASVYAKNTKPDIKANLYDHYALAYSALGKYDMSEVNFKQAILYRQKQIPVNLQNLSKDYQNYSELLMKIGKPNEAIEMGKKSCKLIQQVMGKISSSTSIALSSLANLYLDNKDFNNAKITYDKALLAASSDLVSFNSNLFPKSSSVVYSVAFLRALKGKATTLYLMSTNLRNEKQIVLENSLICYSEAIKILEKIRTANQFDEDKLMLTENENSIYNLSVQVAYELYNITGKEEYINTAFNISERNKAMVLHEKISLFNKFSEGSKDYKLYVKDQKLRKDISDLERKISTSLSLEKNFLNEKLYKLYDEQEEFFNLLKLKYPNYYYSWVSPDCINLSVLQKKLLNTESLVEYILTDSTLYTIIVNSNDKEFIKTKLPIDFNVKLNKYIDEISSISDAAATLNGYNLFINNSYNLYSILINPIKDKIENKSLIIVSDGMLNLLAFETLVTKIYTNSRVDYRYLPYLIINHSISYSNSATLFCNKGKSENKNSKNVLAFAPDYTSSNSAISEVITRSSNSILRGAHDEVNSFNGILKGDYYLNNAATETQFKNSASNYSILHFAMHGESDSEDPGNSRLIFENGGKGNDGFLYAWEINNMKLNPDMVVLSACNTGIGKVRKGEGVMSLARSFMCAGCPSVIMTLWSVSDLSSTDLMKIFYRNLFVGNNKAKALQDAKTEYISKNGTMKSHPYYWAGYVVIGDKSPIKIDSPVNKLVYTSSASIAVFFLAFIFVRRRKNNRFFKKVS